MQLAEYVARRARQRIQRRVFELFPPFFRTGLSRGEDVEEWRQAGYSLDNGPYDSDCVIFDLIISNFVIGYSKVYGEQQTENQNCFRYRRHAMYWIMSFRRHTIFPGGDSNGVLHAADSRANGEAGVKPRSLHCANEPSGPPLAFRGWVRAALLAVGARRPCAAAPDALGTLTGRWAPGQRWPTFQSRVKTLLQSKKSV